MATHFTDASFQEEVFNSQIPVLVDFYAEWCGPCKQMAPVIDKLAVEFEGKFKIGKLDVDANPLKSEEFQVRSIPTLIFFKNGKIFGEPMLGYKSEEVLRKKILEVM
jgi:thioredoxin 1